MAGIDDRIRGALSAEDQAFLDALDREPGMFRQMGDSLKGPMGRWTWLAYGYAFAIFGVGVWAATRMLAATDLRETMLWMGAVGLAALSVAMLKLWLLARMNTLTILRELKRIEVRVSQLER